MHHSHPDVLISYVSLQGQEAAALCLLENFPENLLVSTNASSLVSIHSICYVLWGRLRFNEYGQKLLLVAITGEL